MRRPVGGQDKPGAHEGADGRARVEPVGMHEHAHGLVVGVVGRKRPERARILPSGESQRLYAGRGAGGENAENVDEEAFACASEFGAKSLKGNGAVDVQAKEGGQETCNPPRAVFGGGEAKAVQDLSDRGVGEHEVGLGRFEGNFRHDREMDGVEPDLLVWIIARGREHGLSAHDGMGRDTFDVGD